MAKSRDAFRTISEVAEWLDTPAHVLRFWESKFAQVKPVKRAGGRRYYRPDDMMLLSGIKALLHDQGLTIKGAQKLLREKGVKQVMSLGEDPETDTGALDGVSVPVEEAAPETKSADGPGSPEPATAPDADERREPVSPAPQQTEIAAAPPADENRAADPDDPWPRDTEPRETEPRMTEPENDSPADRLAGVRSATPDDPAPQPPVDIRDAATAAADETTDAATDKTADKTADSAAAESAMPDGSAPEISRPEGASQGAQVLPFTPIRLASERRTGRIPAIPTNPGAFAKPGPLSALLTAKPGLLAASRPALVTCAAQLQSLRARLGPSARP